MSKGAYIGVDGVARKVKKGYIGVPTLSASLGDLEVGATVKLNVNGTATDFLVVQQGNPDATMYDASCDGTWLLMKDIYTKMTWDGTNNNYADSDVRAYLNGDFLGLFDSDVQNAIKQVKIPYVNGTGSGGSVASGTNGLPTNVFLLGGYELGWTTSNNASFPVDGVALSYFSGNGNSNSNRIAYYDGSAYSWYLRSPFTGNTNGVWGVDDDGTPVVISALGVRPALILPSELALVNGTVDGTEAVYKYVARKIKKAYIGVEADVPVYGTQDVAEDITADNISEYFDVANGTYFFAGSGSVFTANNSGVHNSEAKTTLTAKYDTEISFLYSYSTEDKYDLFTLVVAGTTVADAVSGGSSSTNYSYSGTLAAGDQIVFRYTKDQSNNGGSDTCTFSNISITAQVSVQVGTERKSVAKLCWASADPVFANNTWAEIIAACQSGSVPDEWAVGDSKTMNIGGTDYQIDIIGKDHDDYADGSGKAPLTLQMHDCYTTTYRMNSSNTNTTGWVNSEMRDQRMTALLSYMPTEVQAGIKEVNKITLWGNTNLNTTADKLFLLSELEVFGNNPNSNVGEGTQYAYYAAGGSTAKTVNGAMDLWWERSPRSGNTARYCYVNTSGDASSGNASSYCGVAPAFCF